MMFVRRGLCAGRTVLHPADGLLGYRKLPNSGSVHSQQLPREGRSRTPVRAEKTNLRARVVYEFHCHLRGGVFFPG